MSKASAVSGLVALSLLAGLAHLARPALAALPNERELRVWIEEFKASPKGPFERIRWFCKDGTVHPPKAYACRNRGGGIQHGEWTQRAKDLRAGGYAVANVLASLDPNAFVGSDADLWTLRQVLLERFLIGWDDGWIFRGARTYRGALQIEDEEAGSRAIAIAMLGDRAWREPQRFLLLRETVRLLPLQADEGSAAHVRREALVLAEKDKAFTPLRAKIHNQPDAGDAAKVREYASSRGAASLREQYERLAADIDALYAGSRADDLARALAPKVSGVSALSGPLQEIGSRLEGERDPAARVAMIGRAMGGLREHFAEIRDAAVAIEALQLSLALEAEGYVAANEAVKKLGSLKKKRRVELLEATAGALFGAGLLTESQLGDARKGRGKASDQAARALDADFAKAIDHLAKLEPEARRYTEDRLQVSLAPFYARVAESL